MPSFPRDDHDIVRLKEFNGKYYEVHMVNCFNRQSCVKNVMMKASVFQIPF